MVSIDHYAHELHRQLAAATDLGAATVIITLAELHSAVAARSDVNDDCWLAMENILTAEDLVIDSGVIRYVLPRPCGNSAPYLPPRVPISGNQTDRTSTAPPRVGGCVAGWDGL